MHVESRDVHGRLRDGREIDLCGLEHALGDPEGNPEDQVALPQRQRVRGLVRETGELVEVVAEPFPLLGGGLNRRAAPAPHRSGHQEHDQGVECECGAGARDEEIAPHEGWVGEPGDAQGQEPSPASRKTTNESHFTDDPVIAPEQPLPRLVADGRFERLGASVEPHPVALGQILDRVGDLGERSRPLGGEAVEDLDDGLLDDGQVEALVAAREVDVVDLLVAQAGERRLLARDVGHLVATAPHELEQRRGQLVAAGHDALGEQRRHERRGQVVGRLVHVLRRRAGRVLAAVALVREPAQEPGGDERQAGREENPRPGMLERVLQLAAVALRTSCRGGVAADHLGHDVVLDVPCVGRVGVQHGGRVEHAHDHAALGRDVLGDREHIASAHRDAMLEPGRLTQARVPVAAPAAWTFAYSCGRSLSHWLPQACGATSTARCGR